MKKIQEDNGEMQTSTGGKEGTIFHYRHGCFLHVGQFRHAKLRATALNARYQGPRFLTRKRKNHLRPILESRVDPLRSPSFSEPSTF